MDSTQNLIVLAICWVLVEMINDPIAPLLFIFLTQFLPETDTSPILNLGPGVVDVNVCPAKASLSVPVHRASNACVTMVQSLFVMPVFNFTC